MPSLKTLLLLSLPSLTLSLPTYPRSTSKILSDLHRVNADFVALARADAAYASSGNATAVQAHVTQADVDNDRTVVDATVSAPVADGGPIVAYIRDTLEPSIRAAVNATVANKAQVEKAGLSGLLVAQMMELRLGNDNIGRAIGAKIPEAQRGALREVIARVDAIYDYGDAQFS